MVCVFNLTDLIFCYSPSPSLCCRNTGQLASPWTYWHNPVSGPFRVLLPLLEDSSSRKPHGSLSWFPQVPIQMFPYPWGLTWPTLLKEQMSPPQHSAPLTCLIFQYGIYHPLTYNLCISFFFIVCLSSVEHKLRRDYFVHCFVSTVSIVSRTW